MTKLEIDLGSIHKEDKIYIHSPAQNWLWISEEQLRSHLHHMKLSDWKTPLGIFIALLLSILTSTFKDIFGLKSTEWQIIFNFLAIVFFIWFIYTILQYKKYGTTDDIIEKIKKESKETVLR